MVRRVLLMGLALALVATACGDDSGDDTVATTGAGGDVSVTSDDGMVELVIPAGAIPADTDVSVTAAQVPGSLVVPGAEIFVYDLEPSGLEFGEPATLTMTMPTDAEGIVVGVAALGSGPEDLEHIPASFVVSDGTLTVTTEISHFSMYVSWIGGEEITVVDECPEVMIVGAAPCEVSIADFDQHPALRASFRVPGASTRFFTASFVRPDGALYSCQNPTDRLRFYAYVTVGVSDWTLEELFRLVGAKLEYKGGDDYDDFEYYAQADCIVEESFFEDDPASRIPGGVAQTGTDPTGDFLEATDLMSRGFELVEQDPPSGIDITDIAVAYSPGGDVAEVTVCFAGPARSLAGADRSLSIRPTFLRGGQYFFEASYRNGEVHLSGGPDGATVTHTWIAADKIRFRIEGFAPESGDEVRVSVFTEVQTAEGKAVQGDDADIAIP